MNIIDFLKLYIFTVPVFFAIDIVWLVSMSKNFYGKYLGYLMSPSPNWSAAILFYLINIVGIIFFCVSPALEKGTVMKAVLFGALYGLCTYATYDLTNLATIKNWPLIVTIVDMIWGVILSSTVAGVSFMIGKKIL